MLKQGSNHSMKSTKHIGKHIGISGTNRYSQTSFMTWLIILNIIHRVSLISVWYRSHYGDIIMRPMPSHITSLIIVYSTVYLGADQREHQSSTSLAFVRGIHLGLVNSPHKWPVTRKRFHLMTLSWDFNSQKTLHSSPSRASYGVSFISILEKNDSVIKRLYCRFYTLVPYLELSCSDLTRVTKYKNSRPNNDIQGPLLLKWINFTLSTDK